MPFRPEHSLLNLNLDKMHTIDTGSVESLHGLWTVFSKTSNALKDGKRLENLSWRLWNRETFCCCPETQARSSSVLVDYKFSPHSKPSSAEPPELASSVESASSSDLDRLAPQPADVARLELRPFETRTRGREKHITPTDLEKIVVFITQKDLIEPLFDLPSLRSAPPSTKHVPRTSLLTKPLSAPLPSSSPPLPNTECLTGSTQTITRRRMQSTAPLIVEQRSDITSAGLMVKPQSSASTILTSDSRDSLANDLSNSPATSLSTHNIIRGFVPGGAPSSYRSQTQLAPQPVPILKNSQSGSAAGKDKKGASFTLGTSSEDDVGSMGSLQRQSVGSLAQRLGSQSLGSSLKRASFADNNLVTKVQSSPVFDSDEDDSDAATEEEQDASDWEDEAAVDDDEGRSKRSDTASDAGLFQRVDSRPNLTSHRSLLTSMMHEGDREMAFATQAAAHSQPTMARTRIASPAGMPQRQAPKEDTPTVSVPRLAGLGVELSQPQPIPTPGSTGVPLALSPRSTRRNMLSTELTESLRRNLLSERQQKLSGGTSAATAAIKRRHVAIDVQKLAQEQQRQEMPRISRSDQYRPELNIQDYLHTGFEEYHAKGW